MDDGIKRPGRVSDQMIKRTECTETYMCMGSSVVHWGLKVGCHVDYKPTEAESESCAYVFHTHNDVSLKQKAAIQTGENIEYD